MADQRLLNPGDLVRDGLGHWCRVVTATTFHVLVQPLTPVGWPERLQPIGPEMWAFRSDLRADGE